MIKILDSRIAFISGECFFDHQWADPHADPTPWVFAHYQKAFNQIRGGNWPDRYELAWHEGQPSTFWRHYLGDSPLATVTAAAAWEALTPLRLVGFPPESLSAEDGGRAIVQCYGYPHGVVAAVTVHGPSGRPETLEEWRARLYRLRSAATFEADLDNGWARRELSVEKLLEAVLERHRIEHFPGARQVVRSHSPITLNMVVQAEGADPAVRIAADVQRILHAVTAWPRNWKSVKLPALDSEEAFLRVGGVNAADGDLVYAVGRGRTWWRPGLFAPQPAGEWPRLHSLSCLLHNGIAGAVQAESLRLFAKGFRQWPTASKRLDPNYVRRVAKQLNATAQGAGTYRSLSLRALLADPNSIDDTNALLTANGFAAIK